jgi:hypothetical protein
MVTVPVIVLWLATVPIQKGIVAFPPPAPAFHSKEDCQAYIRKIPNSKEGDYVCAPIFVVSKEEAEKALWRR